MLPERSLCVNCFSRETIPPSIASSRVATLVVTIISDPSDEIFSTFRRSPYGVLFDLPMTITSPISIARIISDDPSNFIVAKSWET